jgi:hypothetical protein
MKTLRKKTFRNKKGAVILYCQTDESPETKSKTDKKPKNPILKITSPFIHILRKTNESKSIKSQKSKSKKPNPNAVQQQKRTTRQSESMKP